jgi:hypothetical protein
MARKVIFFTHVPSLGVNRALTAASVQSGCGFLFNAYPYWRISVHHLRGNLQGRETFDARERDLTINMGALSTPFLLFSSKFFAYFYRLAGNLYHFGS